MIIIKEQSQLKNIKVYPHTWETRSLYQSANTPAQRALAGYIVKTGNTSNPICGAAFSMLRDIEYCKQRDIIYDLLFCAEPEEQKQIVRIVEAALKGSLDRFSFTKREITYIITLF